MSYLKILLPVFTATFLHFAGYAQKITTDECQAKIQSVKKMMQIENQSLWEIINKHNVEKILLQLKIDSLQQVINNHCQDYLQQLRNEKIANWGGRQIEGSPFAIRIERIDIGQYFEVASGMKPFQSAQPGKTEFTYYGVRPRLATNFIVLMEIALRNMESETKVIENISGYVNPDSGSTVGVSLNEVYTVAGFSLNTYKSKDSTSYSSKHYYSKSDKREFEVKADYAPYMVLIFEVPAAYKESRFFLKVDGYAVQVFP